MADEGKEEGSGEGEAQGEVAEGEGQEPITQLPFGCSVEKPGTLLMLLQSPEQPVTLRAAKALFQFAKDGGDEGDEPMIIVAQLRGALGDGGGLPVLIKLLTKDAWCGANAEVQAVCLSILARCAGEAVADGRLVLRMRNGEKCIADRNGEEKCRLKTVELGGLRPIVQLLKSDVMDVAGRAAFTLACLSLDNPVRLAVHILGGVQYLLDLMKTPQEFVVNNAALALSQIVQHVEAKDEVYRLHGVKILLDQGVGHESVEVQENAARAIAYCVESEGNLKDLRRQMGIDRLIEMLAALPNTTRKPNDKVRQSACFALAVASFDAECRTEIRMKQGLRALMNCLQSEDSRVQEEALMAIANCAYDMPCKQTIASLAGMRNGIAMLSNPEQPVVANACVALSRLIFDYVSGADFMEEEGVPALLEVLQAYTKAYTLYTEQRFRIESKDPAAQSETELEMPELRLGRSILDACKSCAEQANVRAHPLMSAPGGYFENIMKMIKHTDEVVSGMSCQALTHAAFDVDGRHLLLQMNAIPEFVRCLTYKDVETQLAAARAIGNFAMDSVGRAKVQESGAMPPLVKQLQAKDENGKDAIEPRRAAILAIGKCASDRNSAVELCDIGALSQLLSLMDTHWKQLGQAAEDAVERLLAKSQSAKMWLRGELDYEDMTDDGWFDMGLGKPYTSLQVLQAEKVGTDREVLLADARHDRNLANLLLKIQNEALAKGLNEDVADKRDEQSTQIKRDVVRMIAETISDAMGGSISYEEYNNFGFSTDIQRCKEFRKSNVVWIGDIKKGVCRHRAFLFKYICDKVLPYLCRLERAKIDRGQHVGHAWNCVKFYGDNDMEGHQRTYTVDLMHNVGQLYENGTESLAQDEWVPLYQHKDVFSM